MVFDENSLKQRLEELQRDLSKKNQFNDVVSSLKSLLFLLYPSSSPSQLLYCYLSSCDGIKDEVYVTGLGHGLVSDASKKSHLQSCIAQAKDVLHQPDNDNPVPS